MKHVMRMAVIAGVVVGAWAVSSDRGYTQGADPNAAPNPYKMQNNFFQLPPGRTLGGAIKVQVDHSDGKSIWVFDRCEQAGCNPIQKFDSTGKFVRGFGANMFVQPHGFFVDYEGNVWATDNGIRNGKGGVVVKFSPDGKVLLTLGKPGVAGNPPEALTEPTPGSLQKLVHDLLMKRLLDGQFEESNLTLTELHDIEESLSKSLIALFHARIKYPEEDQDDQAA